MSEREILKELLEWMTRRRRLENREYQELLPEYNPDKEELYGFGEIKEFVDGAVEGLMIAYDIVADRPLHEDYERGREMRNIVLERLEEFKDNSGGDT